MIHKSDSSENHIRTKPVRMRGAISIFIVILIPVLILGCLQIYTILKKKQKENQAYKVAYAVSDAYLSKYNAFMFKEYGFLSTLDEGRLELLMSHYFMKNGFITSEEDLSVEVDYKTLNEYDVFRSALLNASSVMIERSLVQHVMSYDKLMAVGEQIRQISEKITDCESAITGAFDRAGMTDIFERMNSVLDLESGSVLMDEARVLLGEKEKLFYDNAQKMKETIEQAKMELEDTSVQIEGYLETEIKALKDCESAFRNYISEYESHLLSVSDIYISVDVLKRQVSSLEIEIRQVEQSDLKQEDKKAKISDLEEMKEQLNQEIEGYLKAVKDLIQECIQLEVEQAQTSFLDTIRRIIADVDGLFSGVEIGGGIIEISSENERELPETIPQSSLEQRILMNEYLLGLFSSYDELCPRKIDPFDRMEDTRQIKGEVEYLISGIKDERESISMVRLKVMAIREIANLVSIVTDSNKIKQITTAIAAIPQPWRSVAFGVSLIAWGSAESYVDVNQLMKGEGFYYLKTDEEWHLDFQSLLSGAWKSQVSGTPKESSGIFDPKMYYQDYLRILLYMQPEEDILLRAMDLIDSELYAISDQKVSLSNFSTAHHIKLFKKDLSQYFLKFTNQYH